MCVCDGVESTNRAISCHTVSGYICVFVCLVLVMCVLLVLVCVCVVSVGVMFPTHACALVCLVSAPLCAVG